MSIIGDVSNPSQEFISSPLKQRGGQLEEVDAIFLECERVLDTVSIARNIPHEDPTCIVLKIAEQARKSFGETQSIEHMGGGATMIAPLYGA